MEQISIITNAKDVHDKLLKKISTEVGNEITVETEINELSLISNDDNVRSKIVDTISDVIVEEYENKIISKLINQNYFYLTNPEKKNVYNKAISYILNDKTFITNYISKRRMHLVKDKLHEYLETTNNIVLDGFINFRLQEYQDELETVVERAVDDFMVEKEYNEFIKLLKYFVSIQKPKHDAVHIVVKDNSYEIYDSSKQNITSECLAEFMRQTEGNDIKSDDLLISSLISISPRVIYIHNKENIENLELLKTINNVFLKSVKYCDGCLLCKDYKN